MLPDFVTLGSVIVGPSQLAVNVTVPDVDFKFLYFVAFVLAIDVFVVVSVPYVCVTLSIPVIPQPLNE